MYLRCHQTYQKYFSKDLHKHELSLNSRNKTEIIKNTIPRIKEEIRNYSKGDRFLMAGLVGEEVKCGSGKGIFSSRVMHKTQTKILKYGTLSFYRETGIALKMVRRK